MIDYVCSRSRKFFKFGEINDNRRQDIDTVTLVPCGRLSWLFVSFWAHVNIVHRVVTQLRPDGLYLRHYYVRPKADK